MIRLFAAAVWPYAYLNAHYLDHRIRAAQLQAAADMARIEACGQGTCCHTRDRDDELDWCD